MPVRPRIVKRFTVAAVSLSAAFALSVALLGCGVSSTAKEFSWATGSKTPGSTGLYGLATTGSAAEARFNWTDSSENSSAAQTYASNATEPLNHFWEFSPATEQWSWLSVSGAKDPMYVADMPELTPADNAWTWVNGTNPAGATYSLAATGNLSDDLYSWTGSSRNASGDYASNATAPNYFWEFSPATAQWSWVSGSGTQDEMYVAAMPELNRTANSWRWADESNPADASGVYSLAATGNLSGDLYSWTGGSRNTSSAREYASNVTGGSHFWEFTPTPEQWSWASGSSAQEPTYLASMPELSATDNAWTWVNGTSTLGAGGSYEAQSVMAVSDAPGARCATVT